MRSITCILNKRLKDEMKEHAEKPEGGQQKAIRRTGIDDMLKDDNQKATQRKRKVDVKSPEGQQKVEQRSVLNLQPKLLLTDITKDSPCEIKADLQENYEVKFEIEEAGDLKYDANFNEGDEEISEFGEEEDPMMEDSEENTDEPIQNSNERMLATTDKMNFLDYLKVTPNTEVVTVLNMKLLEDTDEELRPIHKPDFENLTESILNVAENFEEVLQESRDLKAGLRAYRCNLCSYQARKKGRVCQHVENHMAVMRQALVSCGECDTRLPSSFMSSHIQSHKQKHPPMPGSIAYIERDIRNDLAFFLVQQTTTTTKYFKCRYCNMQFSRLDVYQSHFILYHTFKYVCRLCGKSLFSYLQMFKHVQCHKAEGHVTGETFPGAGEDESGGPCLYCQRDFPSKEALMQHIYESHSEDTNLMKFPCPRCSMFFLNEESLKQHLRRHKVFKCEAVGCSETFPRKLDLNEHIIKQHGPIEEKSLLCSSCGRGFGSRAKLKEHVQFMHEGREPLKCAECNTQFRSRDSYRNHMKIHTTTTYEYVCEHCGDSFKIAKLLWFHKKKHTRENVSYTCHKCQATFKKQESLEIHLVNHRHFTEEQPESLIKYKDCDVCGKTLANTSQLFKHKKYSHGKPKPCPYCGKEFTDTGNLRIHMWSHTDGQPRCPICDATFRSTVKLNEHLDEEHPGMRKLVESGVFDKGASSKPKHDARNAYGRKPASARETATRQEGTGSSLATQSRDGDIVKIETSSGEHIETLALHETLALQDQALVIHM